MKKEAVSPPYHADDVVVLVKAGLRPDEVYRMDAGQVRRAADIIRRRLAADDRRGRRS